MRKKKTAEEIDLENQMTLFDCPVCERRKQKQREATRRFRKNKEKESVRKSKRKRSSSR